TASWPARKRRISPLMVRARNQRAVAVAANSREKSSERGIAAKKFSIARTPAVFVRGVTTSSSSGTLTPATGRSGVLRTLPSRWPGGFRQKNPFDDHPRRVRALHVPQLANDIGKLGARTTLPG